MTQKKTDDFLREVAEEESDATQYAETTRPADTIWPGWSGYVYSAWRALQDDRHFGSMGGMGRIFYSSASQYARDNDIPLYPFLTYLYALDDVWVQWNAERATEKQRETQSSV